MVYDFTKLQAVLGRLSDDTPARVAETVRTHGRVFLYGAGRSGLMLRALAMRLSQAERTVYVVGETVTPAITDGDLLILASASGKTESVCMYARIAAEAGADILAITATPLSRLTAQAQECVYLDAPTKDNFNVTDDPMGTLFEQALLLLGDLIVRELQEDVAQMRAQHANLE